MLKKIKDRIYSDFFLPSRLEEYQEMLIMALKYGYEMHTVCTFWELIKAGRVVSGRKYFINRHDIDTDLQVARCMWEIERKLEVPASYYFRLTTLDIPFMQEIADKGGDASYHYEEIASMAKLHHYKTQANAIYQMPSIRSLFTKNLLRLRVLTGLPLTIVASHSDFMNRRLELPNHYILKDKLIRKRLNIELETNDIAFMKYVTSELSDTMYPKFYTPNTPLNAIRDGESVIYLSTHPRHWRANPAENLKDNLLRAYEGVRSRIHL